MSYSVNKQFLTPNKYSRPQKPIDKVKGVVIHWVANPGSSAQANRNFFENRKNGNSGYGSAHFVIGLKGEVIQCIPENEIAYHVGSKTYTSRALKELSSYPNNCTIGIECCHVDAAGKMTNETYQTLVELAADLLKKYGLNENNLWLHKEVVGWKDCHKWFVDHPAEWAAFKAKVGTVLKGGKPATPAPAKPAPTKPQPTPAKPKYVLPTGILKQGMSGSAVKQLQVALNAAGFNCGTPDGVFGPKTLAALKNFQSANKLVVDGVYGPATKAALNKKLNS